MTENQKEHEFIVFRLGGREYCIDIMSVREIRGWTPATPLPHAQPFMLGVINLRGTVLPTLDLASRFGFPAAAPSERNAIVVIESSGKLVGLLVESVSDIIKVGEHVIQPTPDVSSAMAREFVAGLIALDGRMISLVSTQRILPEPDMEAA